MGECMVIMCLAGAAVLAIRSLWKTHRAGGCDGDCAGCGKCRGK